MNYPSWIKKPEQLGTPPRVAVTPPKPEEAKPPVVSPSNGIVQFIDISHFQDKMKWDAVTKAGFQAVVAKATDGLNATSLFTEHAANAKRLGIPFGAYCFNRFHANPVRQAEAFARTVENYTHWLVADIEFDKSKTTHAKFGDKYVSGMDEYAAEHSMRFLERLEQLGFMPWIYSNTYYFLGFKNPERFARFPYWASNYTQEKAGNLNVKNLDVSKIPLPKPFKKAVAWQWCDQSVHAKVITGTPNLDANIYFGSLDELVALAKGGA